MSKHILQKHLFRHGLYFGFVQAFEDSTKVWGNQNITPKEMNIYINILRRFFTLCVYVCVCVCVCVCECV